jgi:hypothetical protein
MEEGMKNILVAVIILLSGLLVAQFMTGGKRDAPARRQAMQEESIRPEAGQPETPRSAIAARSGETRRRASSEQIAIRAERFQIPESEQGREVFTLAEHNARVVREYNSFVETGYGDPLLDRESNVSQMQLDIVRKREEARQRRDQLLKMRAEVINDMAAETEATR